MHPYDAELYYEDIIARQGRIFPALHQTGWNVAAQKIHDEVLRLKH